ncbi:MAG: tetratricopeptide repeat protein [Flavobacteriales bacterium]|nr:tetratricopeptide repeat protein [Flavobacteriales bacterium]
MDVYTTEEQQVEAIKKWWRDNGKAVVLGAVIGLGALYGWRYFQAEQDLKMEKASDAYLEVIDAMQNKSAANSTAESFIQEHEGPYASLIELQLAKASVENGNLIDAAKYLRSVQSSEDKILSALATFRLARIEIEQGNLDSALSELNKISTPSWKAQVEALKGDIALKQGKIQDARRAFTASIELAANPVVQMKLDNLPK